ncbi:zinc finger, CCHC-type containing protein [Tanacetum coccineum]
MHAAIILAYDKPLALMGNFAEESSGSSTTTIEKLNDISILPIVVAFGLYYNELIGLVGGDLAPTSPSIASAPGYECGVFCIIDKLSPSWKDFKHTLKHNKEELTLVALGSHLRIEESLMVQDSDKPKGNNVVAFTSTSKLNDSILCHDRLGHVHFKRMQDMSKDGLIPAFDMDTKKCKTCMLNKITKKPFQNVKRKTEVLELTHNDLCDLHATPH